MTINRRKALKAVTASSAALFAGMPALVFGQDEVAAGQVSIKPMRADAQGQYTRPMHTAAGWAHELRTA